MENVYENVRRELSHDECREALQLMLERVHLPENEAKVNAAKEEAGDDMVELMRVVFPIVLKIQIEIVSKFGFAPNHDGLKDFLIRVNQFTNDSSEILDLLLRIREVYLPGFNQKGGLHNGNDQGAVGVGEVTEQRVNGVVE